MKNYVAAILGFVTGAAVGAVVTVKVLNKHYQAYVDDEIEMVRSAYEDNFKPLPVDKEIIAKAEAAREKPPIKEVYEEMINKTAYNKIVESSPSQQPKEQDENDHGNPVSPFEKWPFVITPEEFANGPEDDISEDDRLAWENETLIYYKDGVLADSDLTPIEDIEGVVGEESLKRFGEYEDDSVFVRNPRMMTDFEILLDDENYADKVKAERPERFVRPHEEVD